jgi:DNA-binding transcriptional MerR regulator
MFSDNNLPDTLKPINQVAEEFQLEAHILRFWETKFLQIKPTKAKGNRRLYNKENIEIISKIKDLLYNQGYTIEGAKKYLAKENQNEIVQTQKIENSNPIELDEIITDLEKIKQQLENNLAA